MKIEKRQLVSLMATPVLLVALPWLLPSYSLANETLILAIAVLGCQLLLGYAGLMSFGQGIFFGVGAYASGWVGTTLGFGMPAMLAAGALLGAAAALVTGFFAIRQRGVYFVMLTFAFAQLFYFLAYSFRGFTGGDNGMTDIPRPPMSLLGLYTLNVDSSRAFYVFCAVIFLITFLLLRRVTNSPFGTTLIAIRENEIRAKAIGYDVRVFKLLAFAFSGLLTGLAGALYAPFLGIATLTNIDVVMGQSILIMTIIGGGGSLIGSLLGALFYVVLSSWLSSIWPRWPMLIGFLLVAISLYSPSGLWGRVQNVFISLIKMRRAHDAG